MISVFSSSASDVVMVLASRSGETPLGRWGGYRGLVIVSVDHRERRRNAELSIAMRLMSQRGLRRTLAVTITPVTFASAVAAPGATPNYRSRYIASSYTGRLHRPVSRRGEIGSERAQVVL